MRTAARTLVLLSPDAAGSPASLAGWESAYREDPAGFGRRLIPVLVRGCLMPGPLGELVSIPSVGPEPQAPGRPPLGLVDLDEAEAREALLGGIERAVSGRGRPRVQPVLVGRCCCRTGPTNCRASSVVTYGGPSN